MTKILYPNSIKCIVDDCSEQYRCRGMCLRHYKQLLGREGAYARQYSMRKNNPAYKEMKRISDKRYRERLKENGVLKEKQHQSYIKYISDKDNLIKKRQSNKRYYDNNTETVRLKASAYARMDRDRVKAEVLGYYSNGEMKCSNCGIDVYSLLTLDHIDNDGAKHRRRISKGKTKNVHSGTVYKDIKKNNFPTGFQVLCYNCNFFKEIMRRLK